MEKLLKALRDRYGLKEEDEDKTIAALSEVWSKEDKAEEEAKKLSEKVKTLEEQVKTMTDAKGDAMSEVITLKTRIDELEKANKTASATERVQKALADGKIVPAVKEQAIALAEIAPDKFDALIAGLGKQESLSDPKGSAGGDATTDSADVRYNQEVARVMKENQGISFADAIEIVAKEKPALAQEYEAERKGE